MLKITIPSVELFDEGTMTFSHTKEKTLQLEHSLVSISKWESKWNKPFLSRLEKTMDETVDYVKCMTIANDVDDKVYEYLTRDNIKQINAYIESSMTATTFAPEESKNNREIVTAEIIYQWMVALNVPFECQKWHLNRLFTLIKVCNIKNSPPKKQKRQEVMRRNAALNAARKQQFNSEG